MLEICPTSNLLTKALPDEDAVRDTFRAFVEHGVAFTIATDGPEMMGTHLRDEFELLLRIGALSEDELHAANARGHAASFIGTRAAGRSSSASMTYDGLPVADRAAPTGRVPLRASTSDAQEIAHRARGVDEELVARRDVTRTPLQAADVHADRAGGNAV